MIRQLASRESTWNNYEAATQLLELLWRHGADTRKLAVQPMIRSHLSSLLFPFLNLVARCAVPEREAILRKTKAMFVAKATNLSFEEIKRIQLVLSRLGGSPGARALVTALRRVAVRTLSRSILDKARADARCSDTFETVVGLLKECMALYQELGWRREWEAFVNKVSLCT